MKHICSDVTLGVIFESIGVTETCVIYEYYL